MQCLCGPSPFWWAFFVEDRTRPAGAERSGVPPLRLLGAAAVGRALGRTRSWGQGRLRRSRFSKRGGTGRRLPVSATSRSPKVRVLRPQQPVDKVRVSARRREAPTGEGVPPLPAKDGGGNRAAIRAAGPWEERPAAKPDGDLAPSGRGAEGGALFPRAVRPRVSSVTAFGHSRRLVRCGRRTRRPPATGGASGSRTPPRSPRRPTRAVRRRAEGPTGLRAHAWGPRLHGESGGSAQDNSNNRSQSGSSSVIAPSSARPTPADPLRNEASSTNPCPPFTSAQARKPPMPTPGS